jgi:hypothetical protein
MARHCLLCVTTQEQIMKIRMLAGAAAVAALIATPAMATNKTQQKASGPQQQAADSTGAKPAKKMQHAAKSTSANKTNKMHHARLNESRAMAPDKRGSGFLPADVATGVVGGAFNTAGAALNTAGAIATAPFTPFRGDSYAWYRDPTTGRGTIADANGPKCLPGQVTTINGQKMRCQ